MLFAVGTRVKFKHTGDKGVITELLEDGMLQVYIEADDIEIPAFEEDLIRADEEREVLRKKPPVKAKIIHTPTPPVPAQPERPSPELQYAILKGKGIQLAFEPQYNQEGKVDFYKIFLINDTRTDTIFTFKLLLAGKHLPAVNGKLSAVSIFEVGSFLFDQLNESPVVVIDCWPITTEGTGQHLHRELKIKPKQFFSKLRTAPFLNQPAHLYLIFDKLFKETPEEDLKSYTRRVARPGPGGLHSHQPLHQDNVRERAAFIPEIDLHIEMLIKENVHKLNNNEILKIQLRHFDEYLNKAIRLGIPRVFIIHGVGMGRLRDSIASRLIKNPDVITFKNEYHPRYGYGATEVILEE